MKKRNFKKLIAMSTIAFALLLSIVPSTAIFSDVSSTPIGAQNFVSYNYENCMNGSMNQLHANVGDSVTVRTAYFVTLVNTDKKAYFAIENAAASNTTLDLGDLSPYVEGKKIDKGQMLKDGDYEAYEALANNIDLETSLYYSLSSETIETLLAGQSRKYYEVHLDYHFDQLTEDDFDKSIYYTINSYSKNPIRIQRSGNSFVFNKATSDVKIEQTIEDKEFKVGDTVNVSLKLENTSNIYLEDAVLNIYNSNDNDTYLSNISNVQVKIDENMRICNSPNDEDVSWKGTLLQNKDEKASFHIGSWQGENELRNQTEDNAIYVTFDYIISEEDLSDNGELIIRSTLNASTPKKAFNINNYSKDITSETKYYFTGEPLKNIIALEDTASNLIKINNPTEETPDPETPTPETPDVETPDIDVPTEVKPDEGEVLGETVTHEKNIVSKVPLTDDANKLLLSVLLLSTSVISLGIYIKRKKYNV